MFTNIFFAPYNLFDISFSHWHFIGTFWELEEHTKHPEGNAWNEQKTNS